mmetsp:Transcript_4783/g.4279  ORF Transcript_4783/g.4279 Transcript_4783/m.4279 type:complete len:477 (-) Transcript_4783:41-1471(-)
MDLSNGRNDKNNVSDKITEITQSSNNESSTKIEEISLDINTYDNMPIETKRKSYIDKFFSYLEISIDEDKHNVPKLSYFELFKIFFSFGCRAFGGPVTQIAMMKEELVIDKKWISVERFNRVYAVYQVLPGPEATELSCYFGYICKGRLGAILGGLGFLLPGALLMLLASYLYKTYGLSNSNVQASFRCIQGTVAASILRSTYKLADASLNDVNKEKKTKVFNWQRGYLCMFCFLTAVINLNFFISLAVCGVMNFLFHSKIPHSTILAYFISACTIGFFILYVEENGAPSPNLIGGNINTVSGTSFSSLFILGLIAGLVTFGGAYTTIPFIYNAAVENGKWLTQRQFLDAVALVNVAPTPLVSFVALVGWIGHGFGGSILMLIGIFLPAMSFTIIGHEYFEKLVDNSFIQPFLDGVSSAVIGLLLQTAFQFIKNVVETGIDAVVFSLTFWALFHFTDKFTQPVIIIAAAIAGQILY